MKKQSLITLGLLASTILLTGCGSSTTSDLEEIGKAMEKGESMRCSITMNDETIPADMTMDIIYYIDGENVRVESTFNGEETIAIQKGDTSYVKPNQMMGDTDCEWIVMSDEEEESGEVETVEFNYSTYEADPMYEVVCEEYNVKDSQFDTDGNTCTMDEMIEGMMGGMDLGGIDMGVIEGMEDFDMGDFDMGQF
jgi:hypothetical protein